MKIINIGRAPHNDIIINDNFVSKTHCQITQDDNGNFYVKDLGSRNGTFVNGQRVNSMKLEENDIIRIGNEVLPWQNYFRDTKKKDEPKKEVQLKYAGFWLRFVAMFIDTLVLSFVYGIFYLFIIYSFYDSYKYLSIINLIQIFISWLYFALMESSTNQGTLGKMALSLKVTNLKGEKISFGQATGRYFGKFISGLILYFGFFMAGWTERKQALHDMMANTLVVKKY